MRLCLAQPLADSHRLILPQACEFAKNLPCYVWHYPCDNAGISSRLEWNVDSAESAISYRSDQDRRLNDAALPSLARLSCPTCATQTLLAASRRGWWPLDLPMPTVLGVRVLRYHAGSRCTLAWSLAGWESDVGIVKVTAHTFASHAQTLRSLAQAGFDGVSAFRVPTLRATIPEMDLVMMDQAPGVPFHHLDPGVWPQAAHRVALWLAACANAAIALPASYALHHPLAAARRWSARLQRLAPDLAQHSARLLQDLVATQPPWPPVARRIHGDFGMGHVFCAPHAITVIDWDSCRLGDPAEDAGHFLASLAHLALHRAPTAAIITAVGSFRATYAEALPASAAVLPFYTALACLRKASHVANRSAERARFLVRVGQDALAEQAVDGCYIVSSSRGSGRGCISSVSGDCSAAPGVD